MQEKLIEIGKIGAAVGIKGEARVNLYSSSSTSLRKGVTVTLKGGKSTMECKVEKVRLQGEKHVVKFEGCDDRNTAESFRDFIVSIKEDDLPKLSEGEYYIKDLIGFTVFDLNSNEVLGTVSDYLQNRAQPLWEVTGEDESSFLIPDVEAFVKKIDDENSRIEVALIPGFIED